MNTSEIQMKIILNLDFIVNGMTCSHCKESVESSIKSIDDKIETFVNLATGNFNKRVCP